MPSDVQAALKYIFSFDDPYLAALRDHGRQTWGLEKISALLAKLGNPHRAYPTIHVAGTKGKGSTSALIAGALAASGLKTGLYVSPHLQDWRERIQINRTLIPGHDLAALADDLRPFAAQVDGLSAFEVTTALAFWYFARQQCAAAVIEVGLGGRLDATSIVEPLVSVITSISLDHTQLLGNTLAEIAAEKAAIIKPGIPVVSAPQPPEVQAVIERQAGVMNSRLTLVGRDWLVESVSLSLEGSRLRSGEPGRMVAYDLRLPGRFQVENAAVALAALSAVQGAGLHVTESAKSAALANTSWPGRLDIMSRQPLVIVDGAHNPYSIQQLVSSLLELASGKPLTFVFGCMADKDVNGMLDILLPAARRVIFVSAEMERSALPSDLLARALEVVSGSAHPLHIDLSVAPDIAAAITAALDRLEPDGALCITGSLSVAGEARTQIAQLERGSVESFDQDVASAV